MGRDPFGHPQSATCAHEFTIYFIGVAKTYLLQTPQISRMGEEHVLNWDGSFG
jgi:hypothetical protein